MRVESHCGVMRGRPGITQSSRQVRGREGHTTQLGRGLKEGFAEQATRARKFKENSRVPGGVRGSIPGRGNKE